MKNSYSRFDFGVLLVIFIVVISPVLPSLPIVMAIILGEAICPRKGDKGYQPKYENIRPGIMTS